MKRAVRNRAVATTVIVVTLMGIENVCWAQESAGSVITATGVWAELKAQFAAGGLTMWFLLGLSLLSFAFVLERAFRLTRRAIAPPGLADQVDDLWKKGDYKAIEAVCQNHENSVLAQIIRFIVRHRRNTKEDINTSVVDMSSSAIDHHMMLAYPLAAIATLGPLLGLFGTVIGMMGAFKDLALAGELSNPMMLADDISKALVTTAFGLIVAMPTLFFYNFFKFRTGYLAKLLEEETTGLMSNWFLKTEEN